jgi:hypothetical protein
MTNERFGSKHAFNGFRLWPSESGRTAEMAFGLLPETPAEVSA